MAILKLRLAEFAVAPRVCHFARVRFAGRQPLAIHTHNFVEVFWVEAGEGWHLVNGKRRPLRGGTMVFVRAEDQHGFVAARDMDGLEIANLALSARDWDRLRRRCYPDLALAWQARAVEDREFALSSRARRQLRAAGEELSSGARGTAALDRFLLNLLHLLHPSATAERGPAQRFDTPMPPWLQRACAQVRDPECLAEGVPALVRRAAHSAAHVSRQFQRHLGCTPTQWINQARMAHAAERLAGSDAKILDIIAECGIQNPRHFYTLFQTRFGLTPRQFRLREQRVLRPMVNTRPRG